MRVIRKSSEKEIVCFRCGALLFYENKDIHIVGDMEDNDYFCVKCPECNNNIKVFL